MLNTLAREKLAIISEKPQTTRHQIRAVVNKPDAQIVFVDTPGLHKPKDALGERLNQVVRTTLSDVDVVLFLVDGASGIGAGDAYIAAELAGIRTPVIVAVNKIDQLKPAELADVIRQAEALGKFEVVSISALKGTYVRRLVRELTALLPEGPAYYPEGVLTDQPERVLMAELVREQVLALTRQELPYAVAVEVDEVRRRKKRDLIDVRAKIYVEADSQKGIVIGQGGQMLAEIGTRARAEIERLLGSPIFLDLTVKVRKRWRRDSRVLGEMGY